MSVCVMSSETVQSAIPVNSTCTHKLNACTIIHLLITILLFVRFVDKIIIKRLIKPIIEYK